MPEITYIEYNGVRHVVAVTQGISAMQAARDNNVPGIDGDCGGACACATCHVYVADAWLERVGVPDAMEASMVEMAEDVRSNSRLACQIILADALDGLVLHLPQHQH